MSPLRPSAPSSSQASALSPNAAPFHPGAGRSKARHWADEDIVDAPVSDTVPICGLSHPCRAPGIRLRARLAWCQGTRVGAKEVGSGINRVHNWCTA